MNSKLFLLTSIFCLSVLYVPVEGQQTETVLSHKKNTHSVGGMFLPYPGIQGYYFTNLRYSYAIKERIEIGLDFTGILRFPSQSSSALNEQPSLYFNYIHTGPFIRYYFGKKNFGVFGELGYKFIFQNQWSTEYPDATESEFYYINQKQMLATGIVGSVGIYYHGLAKGRLGLELGLGMGPGYYPNQSNSFGYIGDIQFRARYFFGKPKN